MSTVLDVIGAAMVLIGAFFCLAAALGIVRFPDVLTRMHAATKPQVFGLMVALAGVTLSLRSWWAAALCTLLVALQIVTSATSAHMVARTAYRTDQWDDDHATVDELAEDLEEAGFRQRVEDTGQVPGG
ncbi:monovalent cation/H(+) antiporter subunit G [Aestuariimicrobium ganziense]|uniref:monovalent cation/H(+) antiporter subunit G n=1 Tax=Aestuariimicrobium ganziense TaxID=2773677 RepID=UPI0019429DC3|nr:monovalent cation/H(+) antiporter subunit G [Aestuariimicrobium ganziense]